MQLCSMPCLKHVAEHVHALFTDFTYDNLGCLLFLRCHFTQWLNI